MTPEQARMVGVHTPVGRLLVSTGLVLIAVVFRRELTATMALHMLVHLPAIFLAGVLAAPRGRSSYAFNEQGIPGLLLASLVLAYWMIPKALDHVLVSEWAHALKFLSVFVAGMVLSVSLRQAQNVVKLFFVGNFCWMTAIVGLVYQEHATRLCSFYLLGDQALTGMGLVIYAVLLPVGAIAAIYVKG
jgi:hypothetical protein